VVDFTWSAPVGCPSAELVESKVAALIPPAVREQRWRADAVVERGSDDMWTLHLSTETEGHAQQRDIVAPSCEQLVDVASIVLAVAVDPRTYAPEQPPASGPAATRAGVAGDLAVAPRPSNIPAPVPLASTSPAPTTEQARSIQSRNDRPFALSLVAGGSAGVGATPAFGWGAGVVWIPDPFRVELDALWFPASHIEAVPSVIGGRFDLLVGALRACWSPTHGALRLSACAGGEAGRLRATGDATATVTSFTADSAWVAAKAGGLFVWSATNRVGVRLNVDAVVPFTRNHFFVQYAEQVHTPAPLAGQAFAGVETRFF
jgi:hypothetical protein